MQAPSAADLAPATERRHRAARAYRHGELICGRVDLTIKPDLRLGLAPRERHQLVARFVERVAPAFRHELEQLARPRAAARARSGDRGEPIELIFDDALWQGRRLVARIEPPHARRGELSDNEFVIRERP